MGLEQEVKIILKTLLDDKGFQDLQAQSKKANSAVGDLAQSFKGLLPALSTAAVVAALKQMSDSAMKYADAVDTVADITGTSAEKASEFVVQAQHVGTSAETVANAMSKLGMNLINGSAEFERFGIQIKDTNGELLPLDKVLANIRDRENELGDGMAATTMEMSLFGKSGKELHDFLSANNTEMAAVTEQARRLGLVLNEDTKNGAEQTRRKLNDLQMVGQGLGGALNELVLPAVLELGRGMLVLAESVITAKNAFGDWLTGFHKMKELSKEELEHLKSLVKQYHENETAFKDLQNKNNIELFKAQEKIRAEIRETFGLDMLTGKQRQEIERKVTDAVKQETGNRRILTSDELKAKQEALKTTSQDTLDQYHYEMKLAGDNVWNQRKLYQEALTDHRITVEDHKKIVKEYEIFNKKQAEQNGKDFIAGIKGGYDYVGAITNKFAEDIGNSLSKTFSGIEKPLADVGLSVGGVFGSVASLVVSGFTSLFGNQKSFSEMVEERFKQMSENANKAISEIGKEKTLAQKRIDVLGALSVNDKGVYDQGKVTSDLGIIGMTESEAKKKLLGELLIQEEKELELRKKSIPTLQGEIDVIQKDVNEKEKYIFVDREGRRRSTIEISEMSAQIDSLKADIEARKKMIENYDKASEYDLIKQILDTRSSLSIPAMATGGIVTKPTIALIGESGPEAVVPLNKSGSSAVSNITIQMTNNFSGVNWANEGQKDAIARDLASRVKAYVDGSKRLPTGELRRF